MVSLVAGALAWSNAVEAPSAASPIEPVAVHAERAAEANEEGAFIRPDLPPVPDLSARPPRVPLADRTQQSTLTLEMRMLSHAHELIASEPGAALEILDQHREEFPEGQLREPREASSIEALILLERGAEAERRYYDFLARYPSSESRERLVGLMRRGADPR